MGFLSFFFFQEKVLKFAMAVDLFLVSSVMMLSKLVAWL
jgi:hypothetical protein